MSHLLSSCYSLDVDYELHVWWRPWVTLPSSQELCKSSPVPLPAPLIVIVANWGNRNIFSALLQRNFLFMSESTFIMLHQFVSRLRMLASGALTTRTRLWSLLLRHNTLLTKIWLPQGGLEPHLPLRSAVSYSLVLDEAQILAEDNRLELSTFRWHGFQDRLSPCDAILQILYIPYCPSLVSSP